MWSTVSLNPGANELSSMWGRDTRFFVAPRWLEYGAV